MTRLKGETHMADQERIDAAARLFLQAAKACRQAAKNLLEAVEPTDDEINNAAEILADCLDDERASNAVSYDGESTCTAWAAMLAEQVLELRQDEHEEFVAHVIEETRTGWTPETVVKTANELGHNKTYEIDDVRDALGITEAEMREKEAQS
jgi:hypothetical protein